MSSSVILNVCMVCVCEKCVCVVMSCAEKKERDNQGLVHTKMKKRLQASVLATVSDPFSKMDVAKLAGL